VNTPENQTGVTTVTATDQDVPADTLTFSITGGADAALFSIDSTTGVLTFNTAPDFHAPGDVGGNNVYDVIVQTSDGSYVDTQAIAVTVTKIPLVFIPLPPSDSTPDSTPPPNEVATDTDSVESEDEMSGAGVNVSGNSPGNVSDGSHGSTTHAAKHSNLIKNLAQTDLTIIQQRTENRSIGDSVNAMLDIRQKHFDSITLKSEIRSLLTTWGFLQDLDRVRDDFQEATATEKTYVASSVAATTGLSIGYVFWLLRSGVLLTALLSSLPAWQFVNPLLVLDTTERKKRKKGREDLEDDSVESMFENQAKSAETSKTKTGFTPKARKFRWPWHSKR